eukprot:TRINITY_DN17881_c0_g1_i2.p1 TRINITY_DN17881_c0_g1~~TRINITY_DN17881_c0_g1_i2.p1  ORF type:complete len:193 (-),score=29.55 TRINITY_DN17881_c0_g1_i2:42-620(-)
MQLTTLLLVCVLRHAGSLAPAAQLIVGHKRVAANHSRISHALEPWVCSPIISLTQLLSWAKIEENTHGTLSSHAAGWHKGPTRIGNETHNRPRGDPCFGGFTKFFWASVLTLLTLLCIVLAVPVMLEITRRRPPGQPLVIFGFDCFCCDSCLPTAPPAERLMGRAAFPPIRTISASKQTSVNQTLDEVCRKA